MSGVLRKIRDEVSAILRLAKHAEGHGFHKLLLLVLGLAIIALKLVDPYIYRILIDRVLVGRETALFLPILAAYGLRPVLESIVTLLQNFVASVMTQANQTKLSTRFLDRIRSKRFELYCRFTVGELSYAVLKDAESLSGIPVLIYKSILSDAIQFLAALLIMALVDYRLLILGLAFIPLMGIPARVFNVHIRRTAKQLHDASAALEGSLNESLSQSQAIYAFHAKAWERDRFVSMRRSCETLYTKNRILSTASFWCAYLVDGLMGFLLYFIGGTLLFRDQITLGTLVSYGLYLGYLLNPARSIMQNMNSVYNLLGTLDRVDERERNMKAFQADMHRSRPNDERPTKHADGFTVSFDHVSYRYHNSVDLAVHDVSIRAVAPECLVLFGQSGSGKTTITHLLLGLYPPCAGSVFIGETTTDQLDDERLHEMVSAAFQESALFNTSISRNIAFGDPVIDNDRVHTAAQLACADEFITTKPGGYDHVVGERGALLSGGERQRVALARVFYRDPDVFILDEPTSSLDIATKKRLLLNLRQYVTSRHKICIVISHDVDALGIADRALILDHGRVVREGTPEEIQPFAVAGSVESSAGA